MPLVSCIMPTANRRGFVPEAIRLFLAQDHPEKELVILDDGEDPVESLVPADPRIRYLRERKRRSVGTKRNAACELARGEIIVHWDDDDWYAPWRLSYQLRELLQGEADVTGLDRLLFTDETRQRAWEYVHPRGAAQWVYGATLCYRKAFWHGNRFPDVMIGEDTRFVHGARGARVVALDQRGFFVGCIHAANTSRKQIRDAQWQPVSLDAVHAAMAAAGPAPPPSCAAETPRAPPTVMQEHHPGHHRLGVASPRIAIGVPVHADPRGLAATLQSLRAQTATGYELVLLPDGPDPLTAAFLRSLTDIPQLGVAEPKGGAACLNRLVAGTTADIVLLLESGCQVGPGWLEQLLAALLAAPDHGLAGPSTNRAWNEQGAFPRAAATEAGIAAAAQQAQARFGASWRELRPLYSLADFCYAVRRSVFDSVGPAEEAYGLGPCWEMDLNVRAARAGWRGVWACSSYVHRSPFTARRERAEVTLFQRSRRLYQRRFCRRHLLGEARDFRAHCRGDACANFAPADLIARPLAGNQPAESRPARPAPDTLPAPSFLSCIMPTADRPDFVRLALTLFEQQSWPARELIVVDDGNEPVETLCAGRPGVRYLRLERRTPIGTKRNIACEASRGRIIVHWDDDDWYGAERLAMQAQPIIQGAADLTALGGRCILHLATGRFWRPDDELHRRMFVGDVHGGTLAFDRAIWLAGLRYPPVNLAEDAYLLRAAMARGFRLLRLPDEDQFVYIRHGGNAWRFELGSFLHPAGWQQGAAPPGFSDAMLASYRAAAGLRPALPELQLHM